MELKEISEKFNHVGKKYKLPSFEEINKEFEIEKIDRDSQIILKVVRKVMMEKIVNLLGLLDMFISPNNVPRVYMPYLKSMSPEERNDMVELYDNFSSLTLDCLPLELGYSEKDEAEVILKILERWKKSKLSLAEMFAKMKKPSILENKKEKSYFG